MTNPESRTVCVCTTGYKGLNFLRHCGKGINITQVVSYAAWGKERACYDQLAAYCLEQDIPFSTDKNPSVKAIKTDLIFFVGWQFLVPDMDARCVVFHDSLLPRYRGFAPTVAALINGDPEIGVTALLPGDKADAGPIIGQHAIKIQHPLRIKSAFDALAGCYTKLAAEIASGPLPPKAVPQSDAGASFAMWRDASDYRIDWAQSSDSIQRFIFACGWPYDGAQTLYAGRIIIIEDAESIPDALPITQRKSMVGKFLENQNSMPLIICAEGLLRIRSAIDEDGKAVDFKDSLRQRLG